GFLLWRYLPAPEEFQLQSLFLPPAVLLITLVCMHGLIALLLPLRWPVIRHVFHQRLEARVHVEFEQAFAALPLEVAEVLKKEREEVDAILLKVHELANWLKSREQAASIAGLYGKP